MKFSWAHLSITAELQLFRRVWIDFSSRAYKLSLNSTELRPPFLSLSSDKCFSVAAFCRHCRLPSAAVIENRPALHSLAGAWGSGSSPQVPLCLRVVPKTITCIVLLIALKSLEWKILKIVHYREKLEKASETDNGVPKVSATQLAEIVLHTHSLREVPKTNDLIVVPFLPSAFFSFLFVPLAPSLSYAYSPFLSSLSAKAWKQQLPPPPNAQWILKLWIIWNSKFWILDQFYPALAPRTL